MNMEETHKFLTIMKAAYQNSPKNYTFDDSLFTIQRSLWQNAFADCSYQEVFTAFNIWLATEPFAPSIAELNRLVKRNKNPETFISPERAWEVVNSAVKRFGSHNPQKAFETFSEPIKRAVRSVGGWQKICETNLGQPWDFLRKNFMEAYNDFGQEVQEPELLPTQVLRRLQQMSAERIEGPKS